ncbi:hypothetical protein Bpfe_030611, partial [Biomphalaria pfeifferi]
MLGDNDFDSEDGACSSGGDADFHRAGEGVVGDVSYVDCVVDGDGSGDGGSGVVRDDVDSSDGVAGAVGLGDVLLIVGVIGDDVADNDVAVNVVSGNAVACASGAGNDVAGRDGSGDGGGGDAGNDIASGVFSEGVRVCGGDDAGAGGANDGGILVS